MAGLRQLGLPALILMAAGLSGGANADDDRAIGKKSFEAACSGCHSENPVPRAMSPAQLAKLPPEKIFNTQRGGLMILQASALNELEQRAVDIAPPLTALHCRPPNVTRVDTRSG